MQEVFENIIEKLRINANSSERKEMETDYFEEKKEYKGQRIAFRDAIDIVNQEAEKYNNGWIQVDEELPQDGDNRYYMCIVENHEEDPPMCCQYDEECGFGFYQDIYDEHTLGFVDCVFQTNEELGYEKVIAWQQLLPYQPKGE